MGDQLESQREQAGHGLQALECSHPRVFGEWVGMLSGLWKLASTGKEAAIISLCVVILIPWYLPARLNSISYEINQRLYLPLQFIISAQFIASFNFGYYSHGAFFFVVVV